MTAHIPHAEINRRSARPGALLFCSALVLSFVPGRLVVANLAGFVFPVGEGAGKTCKCSIAPPLPGEAYASPGVWTGDEGREFCAEQRDQVTYAGGSNGGQTAPIGREEGSRGTIRKVPRALFLFQVSFCRTKRNLTAGGNPHRGESHSPARISIGEKGTPPGEAACVKGSCPQRRAALFVVFPHQSSALRGRRLTASPKGSQGAGPLCTRISVTSSPSLPLGRQNRSAPDGGAPNHL